MPRPQTTTKPATLRLIVLRTLLERPSHYNATTLAEELGERPERVRDAVNDIADTFGITLDGTLARRITVVLPAQAVLV